MRYKLLLLLLTLAFAGSAQRVLVASDVVVVDSAAYFPQLDKKGERLLYSPTDASRLCMLDLKSCATTVICDNGMPGFDACFAPDGKVYYVTQERVSGNLVYRTGWEFDPKRGVSRKVLDAQHGQVLPLVGNKGAGITGERESFNLNKVGRAAFTRGNEVFVVDKGKLWMLRPVPSSVGLLWASVSPDGKHVMFEAAGKGLYVCDMQGRIEHELGMWLMPSWLDNNFIVAMSNVGNVRLTGSQIYAIPVKGGDLIQLTDNEDGAVQPMVSGKRVAYSTRSGEVHVMTLDVK